MRSDDDDSEQETDSIPTSAWLVLGGGCLLVLAPIVELVADAAGVSSGIRSGLLISLLAASMILMIFGAFAAKRSQRERRK
jgi:xanthine/uracil/vitamin C permease (AzgA family)